MSISSSACKRKASNPVSKALAAFSDRMTKGPRLRAFFEADDGDRTHDLRLGKPTLYQLSYVRAKENRIPLLQR
jgi:hypothetical protein